MTRALAFAYGVLLVFLTGDHRYGWLALAVGVPSLLILAAYWMCVVVANARDCALIQWDGCQSPSHPACRDRAGAAG